MSDKDEMISVPAQVLQDLLWNYGLNIAATGPTSKCEEVMEQQCGVLQGYALRLTRSSNEGKKHNMESIRN
jgi:hypothetical protein